MMNTTTATLLLALLLGTFTCLPAQRQPDPTRTVDLIAFGSCAHQNKRQPILEEVVKLQPDLFNYLGDNIYGDTRDMEHLREKYAKLAGKDEFQALCAAMPVLATWDDHDYWENDAGRHYPFQKESKEIFLDFWKEPANSERRRHPDIYHAHLLGPPEQRVQVILLDTRTFRDDLYKASGKSWKNDYMPNPSPDSTFLGKKQWKWLHRQLRDPARLRIIASSNQFSHAYNGWESWTNVPRERERMLNLIRDTKAEGVVFISGDVHWGELSRLDAEGLYPIYDLTSSGITQTWPRVEENENRVGEAVSENNVGLIRIDWSLADPAVVFELRNKQGEVVLRRAVRLGELGFGGTRGR
jgi:alkaline phosphatase D